MNFSFRPSTDADYPALAALLKAAGARYDLSAEELLSLVRGVREHPSKPHFWEVVVEQGGQIVGSLTIWQNGGRFDPDRYEAELVVHPDVQGRGLGRQLAALAQEHLHELKAREVISGTYNFQARGLDFLARQGFTEQFRYFDNVLDLREWDAAKWPTPALPVGMRLLNLSQLIAEQGEEAAWRAFHAAFAEAREDVPSEMPPSPTFYDVFRKRAEQPGFLLDGVFLAVTSGGEVAALTELRADPADALTLKIGLTGTRRAYRRMGLALAVKLAGLHYALKRGVRFIKTGNATSNRPILALNQALGFRPERVFIEMVKTLKT